MCCSPPDGLRVLCLCYERKYGAGPAHTRLAGSHNTGGFAQRLPCTTGEIRQVCASTIQIRMADSDHVGRSTVISTLESCSDSDSLPTLARVVTLQSDGNSNRIYQFPRFRRHFNLARSTNRCRRAWYGGPGHGGTLSSVPLASA